MATTTTNTERKLHTIGQIKRAAYGAGSHWFEPSALRFFASRISKTVYPVPGGALFVSSEQFRPFNAPPDARKYSVRSCNADGDINTVGEFQQYETLKAAHCVAARLQRSGFSLL